MSTDEPLQFKAAKLPHIRAYLEKDGVYDQVLGKLSPETKNLLLKPPLLTAWVPGHRIYEIYAALIGIRGVGSGKKMSFQTSMTAYGTVLTKFVTSMFTLVGATPATLISNTNSMVHLFEKGTEYAWERETEKSGLWTVHTSEPIPAHGWEVFEAIPMVAFRFSNCEGMAQRVDVWPGTRQASWRLEW